MDDPFSELKKTLESIFHFEPIRNGKFVYPEIQQLKNSMEKYEPSRKESFIALAKSLRAALPHFEKWRINFDSVKEPMDFLAKIHRMPAINWDQFLAHPKVSPKFQFSATHHAPNVDFLTWISELPGPFDLDNPETDLLDVLIACEETPGFSQRLTFKLKEDPQFLAQFIMQSENNFIKVLNARIALYLTDVQIAEAIIKYLPHFQDNQERTMQVEQQIDKLNGILSNSGRSVFTLLRNAEAKSILNDSEHFRIYQSAEYEHRHEPPSALEGRAKP